MFGVKICCLLFRQLNCTPKNSPRSQIQSSLVSAGPAPKPIVVWATIHVVVGTEVLLRVGAASCAMFKATQQRFSRSPRDPNGDDNARDAHSSQKHWPHNATPAHQQYRRVETSQTSARLGHKSDIPIITNHVSQTPSHTLSYNAFIIHVISYDGLLLSIHWVINLTSNLRMNLVCPEIF